MFESRKRKPISKFAKRLDAIGEQLLDKGACEASKKYGELRDKLLKQTAYSKSWRRFACLKVPPGMAPT